MGRRKKRRSAVEAKANRELRRKIKARKVARKLLGQKSHAEIKAREKLTEQLANTYQERIAPTSFLKSFK